MTRALVGLVAVDDPGWVRFWECYPRREAKLEARKAWAQLNPDAALVDAIIQALGWQRQTKGWGLGFVPLPASYLRGRRFDDEPPVTSRSRHAPVFTEWDCPHVDQCASRWRCDQATALGRKERER